MDCSNSTATRCTFDFCLRELLSCVVTGSNWTDFASILKQHNVNIISNNFQDLKWEAFKTWRLSSTLMNPVRRHQLYDQEHYFFVLLYFCVFLYCKMFVAVFVNNYIKKILKRSGAPAAGKTHKATIWPRSGIEEETSAEGSTVPALPHHRDPPAKQLQC